MAVESPLAGLEIGLVGEKLDLPIVIGEAARGDKGADRRADAELLSELPRQAGFGRLSRLDLATRELPMAFEVSAGLAPGQEYLAGPTDDGGRYSKYGMAGHRTYS